MKRYLYKDNTIVNQPAIVKDGHQLLSSWEFLKSLKEKECLLIMCFCREMFCLPR